MEAPISIDLVIVLSSAALAGFIAEKLKQPTLVAYLVAGIIVGPGLLSLADPTDLLELMAELGLAFLLFLIGLKLDVGEISHMLKPVLKTSVPHMAVVAASSALLAYILGFDLLTAAVMGAAFMYSSTAVVEKILSDTGGISKEFGKLNTGALLVQDLVVVILMVLISSAGGSVLSDLAYAFGFLIVALIVALVASRRILPLVVKEASRSSVNLFVTGLAWLFIFVVAADLFGLSIEVGAFVAGLSLGQLKYSNELTEKMDPITSFFIAMFFIDFGLNLSIGEFLEYWQEALILSAFLMAVKYAALRKLAEYNGFPLETSFKSGLTMVQTSEFSLIFAATASTAGLLGEPEVGLISLVAIITMGLSSYLLLFHNKIFDLVHPGEASIDSREDKKDHAVIAGYFEGLEDVMDYLGDEFEEVEVIDSDPDVEDSIEEVEFGDFHHRKMREELGVDDARIVMINFEDTALVKEVVEETDGKVLARSQEEIEGAETYTKTEIMAERLKKHLEDREWN